MSCTCGFQYPLTGAELRYDRSSQIGSVLNKVDCVFLVVHRRERKVNVRSQVGERWCNEQLPRRASDIRVRQRRRVHF
jgi:hypothetical protein